MHCFRPERCCIALQDTRSQKTACKRDTGHYEIQRATETWSFEEGSPRVGKPLRWSISHPWRRYNIIACMLTAEEGIQGAQSYSEIREHAQTHTMPELCLWLRLCHITAGPRSLSGPAQRTARETQVTGLYSCKDRRPRAASQGSCYCTAKIAAVCSVYVVLEPYRIRLPSGSTCPPSRMLYVVFTGSTLRPAVALHSAARASASLTCTKQQPAVVAGSCSGLSAM